MTRTVNVRERREIRWTKANPWLGLLGHDKEFVFNPEYNGKPLKLQGMMESDSPFRIFTLVRAGTRV